jgi:hypothetical protein
MDNTALDRRAGNPDEQRRVTRDNLAGRGYSTHSLEGKLGNSVAADQEGRRLGNDWEDVPLEISKFNII